MSAFAEKYAGRCVGWCDGVVPADEVEYVDDALMHIDCEDAEGLRGHDGRRPSALIASLRNRVSATTSPLRKEPSNMSNPQGLEESDHEKDLLDLIARLLYEPAPRSRWHDMSLFEVMATAAFILNEIPPLRKACVDALAEVADLRAQLEEAEMYDADLTSELITQIAVRVPDATTQYGHLQWWHGGDIYDVTVSVRRTQ